MGYFIIDDVEFGGVNAQSANGTSYDNTQSGSRSTQVQGAVDQLYEEIADVKSGTGTLTYLNAYSLEYIVTFDKPYPNTNYAVSLTSEGLNPLYFTDKTINGFKARMFYADGTATASTKVACDWIARFNR